MSTINYTCVCGKPLRFRSEHAGRKTKCPECGEALTVPDSNDASEDVLEDYDDTPAQKARPSMSKSSRKAVTGKRVIVQWNQFVPTQWGRTTFEILDGSLVDNTQSWLTRRHLELLLSDIDSAEIRVQPNPALLVASVVLIPFIIGLFVLPFYFIKKNKFLIFHSGSNATALVISGPEEPYLEFMQMVLMAAEKAKRNT